MTERVAAYRSRVEGEVSTAVTAASSAERRTACVWDSRFDRRTTEVAISSTLRAMLPGCSRSTSSAGSQPRSR